MIAVWDLAGQELDAWLGERQDVFYDSTVIVCLLSVAQGLKENVKFLINFLKVKEQSVPNADLFILLHKCDLVSNIEAHRMVINIIDFVKVKYPSFTPFCNSANIFKTSISDSYYLRTMMIAFKIIRACIKNTTKSVSVPEFHDVEKKMFILLSLSPGVWYSIQDIMYKLALNIVSANQYLEDLVILEFIEKRKNTFYGLSEKGEFFVRACKKQSNFMKMPSVKENLGIFMYLKTEKRE